MRADQNLSNMKTFNGKPLYDIVVDPKSKDSGTNRIDFVSRPANKMPLLKFSEETQKAKYDFNEDRGLVTFVIMQPDFPMERIDKNGDSFYVQFSAETIEIMRDKFMMLQKLHERGAEHKVKLEDMDAPLVETWITDESRGIPSPKGLETADRSWLGTCRILNPELKSAIDDGTFTGVSLEGVFDLYETFSEVEKIDEGLFNIFKSVIFNNSTSVFEKFDALKTLAK